MQSAKQPLSVRGVLRGGILQEAAPLVCMKVAGVLGLERG